MTMAVKHWVVLGHRLIYKHFKNTTREFALIRAGPGHCVDLNQQEKPVGARGLEFWCR